MTDLVIVPGDTEIRQYEFNDGAGSSINLTGYTVAASVVYLNGSLTPAVAIDSPASDGLVTMTLTPAQTTEIADNLRYGATYHVRLTSPSGYVTTLIQGQILLNEGLDP